MNIVISYQCYVHFIAYYCLKRANVLLGLMEDVSPNEKLVCVDEGLLISLKQMKIRQSIAT